MNDFIHHKRLVLLSAAKAEFPLADLVDLIDALAKIDRALAEQPPRKVEDTWAALCEDDCRAGIRYLKPLLPKFSTLRPGERAPKKADRYRGVYARRSGKFIGEVTRGGQKIRTKMFTDRDECADALAEAIAKHEAQQENCEVEPLPSDRSVTGYRGVRETDTGHYVGRRMINGQTVTTATFETPGEAAQALAELASTARK